MSSKYDRHYDLELDEIEAHSLEVPCNIEDIGTKTYNFHIDNDPEHGFVYLCGNYDNNPEYDTPFFMNPEDAYKLGQLIANSAMNVMINMQRLNIHKDIKDKIKTILEKYEVVSFDILPDKLWTIDPTDQFYGMMVFVLSIKYKQDDEVAELSARIMSDYVKDKPTYLDLLESKVKENYNISKEVINFHINKYKDLYNFMMKKWDKFIKTTDMEKVNLSNTISPLKREMADVQHISQEITKKIKEEQERMKKEDK